MLWEHSYTNISPQGGITLLLNKGGYFICFLPVSMFSFNNTIRTKWWYVFLKG